MLDMATVIELPDPVNRVISATVKALYKGKDMSADEIARHLGISHGTMNGRLNCHTSWTAVEVRKMADLFDVRISDLYDGMGGTFGPKPPVSRPARRKGRDYSSTTIESATELMQNRSGIAA